MRSLKAIFVFAVLAFALAAGAQQSVTATGSAAILNNDAAQARDRAVESALRAAVEQVMGTMVDSESLVKNNELLSDKIYTQTAGYISNYKIVSEKADKDTNIYSVTIEAQVNEGSLEQDLNSLGILMRRMKMPRVAVALKENGQEASATLLRLLKDKGFNVVDTGNLEEGFYGMQEGAQSDLLKKYGAEVVILGALKGGAGGSVGNSNLVSFQASLSLKAIQTDTRHVLGTASGSGKAVHVGEEGMAQASRQAATLAGNDIIRQITAQWSKEVSSTRQLVLVLEGASADEASKMASKLQKEGRGIQDVVVHSASGEGAELEVSMQGDAVALAQEAKKLFPGWRVVSQTAARLTLGR